MIDSRAELARIYVKSWFLIDVVAIIPMDLLVSNDMNSLVRITRVGKLYKLIKVTRLVRLLKVFKQQGKIISKFNNLFKFGRGFEKMAFLILLFLMTCHLMACIWIFSAEITTDDENPNNFFNDSWIAKYRSLNLPMSEVYVMAIYYTVTTISTVGYGDISA